MNIVEAGLNYVTSPMSVKYFNRHKTEKYFKNNIDRASIYIIVKRENPYIDIFETEETKKYMNSIGNSDDEYIPLVIKSKGTGNNINACYIIPANSSRADYISSVKRQEMALEDMICNSLHNCGQFIYNGDITPFITYDVMYVGQCADELYASKIVGDKKGDTSVYSSNEDISKKNIMKYIV